MHRFFILKQFSDTECMYSSPEKCTLFIWKQPSDTECTLITVIMSAEILYKKHTPYSHNECTLSIWKQSIGAIPQYMDWPSQTSKKTFLALAQLFETVCLKPILPFQLKPPSRHTCSIIISKLTFSQTCPLFVCVCVCVCVCACVCVCVCVHGCVYV